MSNKSTTKSRSLNQVLKNDSKGCKRTAKRTTISFDKETPICVRYQGFDYEIDVKRTVTHLKRLGIIRPNGVKVE